MEGKRQTSGNPMQHVDRDIETTPDRITLRELQDGGHALVFECKACGHRHNLDVAGLIRTHGPESRVGYIRRHAVCDICGPRQP